MKRSKEVEVFLNLTLSLINPGLFRCGLSMLRELWHLSTTKTIATEWQSVYTGIQTISNRITPPHRDSKGRPEWFDLLLSYCDKGASTPYFSVNDLSLKLKYSSGTVIAFCGTIFEHGVESWGAGDRVCSAHFMRESVRERLGVPPAGWVDRGLYIDVQYNNHFQLLFLLSIYLRRGLSDLLLVELVFGSLTALVIYNKDQCNKNIMVLKTNDG